MTDLTPDESGHCPTHGWTGHRPDYTTNAGQDRCLCGAAYGGPPAGDRDGDTFDPKVDRRPLNAQAQRVWDSIAGAGWLTLAELAADTGDPEASISARLRDFKKPRFGAHAVDKRRRDGGRVYEYRLIPAGTDPTLPLSLGAER